MLIVDTQVHIWAADTPQRPWPRCHPPHRAEPFDRVLAIAKRPNVAAKTSAMPRYSDEPYPHPSLQAYLRQAYDASGPKRLFWGTDITRTPITYRQHVTLYTEAIPWLTVEDREWIMGRGACEWLGWKLS